MGDEIREINGISVMGQTVETLQKMLVRKGGGRGGRRELGRRGGRRKRRRNVEGTRKE